MTWIRLLRLELVGNYRQAFPQTWVRWSLLLAAGAFGVLGSVGMALAPFPGEISGLHRDQLLGVVLLILVVSLGVGLASAAGYMEWPERVRLHLLAPRPPGYALSLRLGAIGVSVALPVLLLLSPIVVAMGRVDPSVAAWAGGTALLFGAWGAVAAMGVVVALVNRLGPVKGGQTARGLAGLAGLAFIFGTEQIVLISGRIPSLRVLLVASVVLLPAAAGRVARGFEAALRGERRREEAGEPAWGRVRWWRRVVRSNAPWRLLTALVMVALILSLRPPLHLAILGGILVMAAGVPVEAVLAEEHARPDRWKLAPHADVLRRQLLGRVVLPSVGVVLLATLALGATPAWAAAVTGLALLWCLVAFVPLGWARYGLQAMVVLGAMLTATLA